MGARPDERTLPLSSRLERFRDTEANTMHVVVSGNGVELIHTKWVPRCFWITAWTAFSLAFLTAVTAWEVTDSTRLLMTIALVIQTVCALAAGVLPLACSTARVFGDSLQRYMPFYFFQMLVSSAVNWAATGNGFTFCYWLPFIIGIIGLLTFRRGLFLVGFLNLIFVGYSARAPFKCLAYRAYQTADLEYLTYSECVVDQYGKYVLTIASLGSSLLFMLVREVVNYAWAFRAARSSREHHR